MPVAGRLRTSHFGHDMFGHGHLCQGGYGGVTHTVNNVTELNTAMAAAGPKVINIATAGEYVLTEDLDFDVSYTTLTNTSGGNVQFTGAGLRIGTAGAVNDIYISEVEVKRGDVADVTENNGDPVHINPSCSNIYLYKCAFYEGVDDASIRSGGVTFHLCQFGPNWDSQHHAESESNGGDGHAFGPFTTATSTGAALIYCLCHSLEDRCPMSAAGYSIFYGCVTYNCQLGPTVNSGSYCEFMYGRVRPGPDTVDNIQNRGLRINSGSPDGQGFIRNYLVDGYRDDETAAENLAVFDSDRDRMVDRDPTQTAYPLPAPDTAANNYTTVINNVGPTNKSSGLSTLVSQVAAGTGSILRS